MKEAKPVCVYWECISVSTKSRRWSCFAVQSFEWDRLHHIFHDEHKCLT